MVAGAPSGAQTAAHAAPPRLPLPRREQPDAEKDRASTVLFILGQREARVVDVSIKKGHTLRKDVALPLRRRVARRR